MHAYLYIIYSLCTYINRNAFLNIGIVFLVKKKIRAIS